jgi:hypothetical protein
MAIDWDGLANKTLNTAIDVIFRKVEGVKPAAGVGISTTGVSLYGSAVILPLVLMATVIVGLVLLLRKF